ncbi:MAG: hypothetical protein NC548_64575 [Lachnospiraceae bacterium]|nr:hypothetical protein [Lachnospiraceae bacterium]
MREREKIMHNIKSFINKLQNLKNYSLEVYPFMEYDCEIAYTQKCAYNGDIENPKFASMWQEVFGGDNFELHHPTYNHIKTRAIESWRPNEQSLRGLILFIDKDNLYPWVLLVTYEMATFVITLEKFYINGRYMSNSDHDRWLRWRVCQDCLEMVRTKNLNAQNVRFRESPYCLNMQSERPHHYFTDALSWYHHLGLKNKIQKSNFLFFKQRCMKFADNDEGFLSIPLRLGYNKRNFDYVREEALKDFNFVVADTDKLDRFDKTEITAQEIENLMKERV